jgi:Flp pilus assembly pilin Flp
MDFMTKLVVRGQNAWYELREREEGQGLVEYALIISVVALGAIVALVFLKDQIKGLFSKAGNSISANY